MLEIAICDDNREQLDRVYGLLKRYLQARPSLLGRVTRFSSGTMLLSEAKVRGGFDLYLLDVIMPALNGIDTGKKLRELGDGGEIIYLTVSSDYAVDSYSVQAFFYLLKPVEEERFFSVMDAATDALIRRRTESILVDTVNGLRRILLDKILYVERIGRRMRYYCVGEALDTHTIQTSFRKATEELLRYPQFCLCGASFLLNLTHVIGIENQTALLDSGDRVPLPRSSAASFKSTWGRFWLEAQGKW